MAILVKYIVRNIKEKKFRTILIISSIMISSALFLVSSSISGSIEEMYVEGLKQNYGTADILIQEGTDSPSPFFSTSRVDIYKPHFDYIINGFTGYATFKPNSRGVTYISLLGLDYNDMQTLNPFILYEDAHIQPFEGKKIILSKTFATKYNLSLGEYIDLDILGDRYKFFICGIAEPHAYFNDTWQSNTALITYDSLASIYDARGRANISYIKLKNSKDKNKILGLLSEDYKQYHVVDPFIFNLSQQTKTLNTSFILMTIVIFIMSIYIIYSSFKVLTIERIPVIGTFRSIGATKITTSLVLLIETFLYGLIGGILGSGLGILILHMILYISNPIMARSFGVKLNLTPFMFIGTILVSILTSFISTIIPIINVSNMSVKDVVLNSVDQKNRFSFLKFMIGITMLTLAILIPILIPPHKRVNFLPLLMICLIIIILSFVFFTPYIVNLIAKLLGRVCSFLSINEGILAARNLVNNKSIFNNISLLTIGISTILMINIISHSVGKEFFNLFINFKYDISTFDYSSNPNFEVLLQTVDGVDDVYGIYELNNIDIIDKDFAINSIHGINQKYPHYININLEESFNNVFKTLDSGRNIFLTKSLQESLGIKNGDIIKLRFPIGIKDYTVVGSFSTVLHNGNYALISERFLKLDSIGICILAFGLSR